MANLYLLSLLQLFSYSSWTFGPFHFNIHTPPLTKDFEIFLTFSKMLFSLKTPEKFIHEHIPSESLQHESGRCKKFCFFASYPISYTSSGNLATAEGVHYCETQKILNTCLQPFSRVRFNSLPTIWTLCTTIWTAGKGYKRSNNLCSPAMCVKVACFTLELLRIVCLFSLFIP